jgi:hypothetical protein
MQRKSALRGTRIAGLIYFAAAAFGIAMDLGRGTDLRPWFPRLMFAVGWWLLFCLEATPSSSKLLRWSKGTGAMLLCAGLIAGFIHFPETAEKSRIADSDEPGAETAIDAVTRFHNELGRGEYRDLCLASESSAFHGMSCPQHLAYVHDRLGVALEANRTRIMKSERAGKPLRLGLDYVTRYEGGEAKEHFEWSIGNAQTTLTSYSVLAEALQR